MINARCLLHMHSRWWQGTHPWPLQTPLLMEGLPAPNQASCLCELGVTMKTCPGLLCPQCSLDPSSPAHPHCHLTRRALQLLRLVRELGTECSSGAALMANESSKADEREKNTRKCVEYSRVGHGSESRRRGGRGADSEGSVADGPDNKTGIDAKRRGLQPSLDGWCRLARAL